MNKIKICEGITLYTYPTGKFKTDTFALYIPLPNTKQYALSLRILADVLTYKSEKYTNMTELNRALDDLYSTGLSCRMVNMRGRLFLRMGVDFLKNRFTDGENLSLEVFRLMKEILYHPYLTDSGFDEEAVAYVKEQLKNRYLAMDEYPPDKAGYLFEGAIYRVAPLRNSRLPSPKELDAVTQKDLLDTYRQILDGEMRMTYVGDLDEGTLKEQLSSVFAPLCKGTYKVKKALDFTVNHRETPKTLVKSSRGEQCLLLMGLRFTLYNDNLEKRLIAFVTSRVFGGGGSSLLFRNVREKKGLCYSVSSAYRRSVDMMTVYCGTEKPYTAKKEILVQWERLKKGDFSKEALKRAIKDAVQGYSDSVDTPAGIEDYYSQTILDVDVHSPEECIAFLKTVTKEQVIVCANSLEEDTVLLMKGKHYEAQSDI